MKIELKIEIEFESWFYGSEEPKTKEDWNDFFVNHFIPESPFLGIDDGERQEMIAINNINLEVTDIK